MNNQLFWLIMPSENQHAAASTSHLITIFYCSVQIIILSDNPPQTAKIHTPPNNHFC
ncbi:hypothetical protein [Neisseria leonii]|uniref:hypothetical protein n=1 Tax=Neisseria leonii TaxID=2995413 RepID=UPI00239406FC|nr:hypothetical protein [Neisseria sp. 3986]